MSEIEKAIECLSCECGCAELDLSNGERIDEENVEKFASSCRLAIQALQEKAEREKYPSGWIPVSERLPDAYQLVLATYEDKRIEIAFIHLGGVWSGYFWGEVIAWQPLPEPYKGVEE